MEVELIERVIEPEVFVYRSKAKNHPVDISQCFRRTDGSWAVGPGVMIAMMLFALRGSDNIIEYLMFQMKSSGLEYTGINQFVTKE